MRPIRFHILLLFAVLCVSGCSPRIYWDEHWLYEALINLPRAQTVRVESIPPSSLWVDGQYAGKTPLDIRLSYSFNQIRLFKNQYKETPGGKKEVLDKKERKQEMPQAVTHTLQFKAPGYHDRFQPVETPLGSAPIRVALRKKSGLSYEIECKLTVNARREHFSRIEGIISEHALSPGVRKSPDRPVENGGPDQYRQTFEIALRDADALGQMTDALFAEAEKRNFVFDVSRARTEATFSTNPTREFRAVWVSYLDWPPQHETDPARQKQAFIRLLDEFRRLNINAVIFQVRPACDAFYRSEKEPWSRLLTGTPGSDPGYDPLAFAVREAHLRGIELHAWLNPFRTRLSTKCQNSSETARNHISKIRPEWLLRFRLSGSGNCCCYEMLNPGIPQVTEYVADIASDIVRRYDVDGIHFDDTFYPYPRKNFAGIRGEDRQTYRKFRRRGQSVENWRRENINRLIHRVNTRIKKEKAHIRFGVSPFGIWRNGIPEGTVGMSACDAIYSDALAWLENKSVDYLAPQLYWKTGGQPDYNRLLSWWAGKVRAAGRHIYPGQIVYYVRTGPGERMPGKPGSAEEITRQVRINRESRGGNVLGNAFYRAIGTDKEILGPETLKAMLGKGLYATPALPPVMPWLDVSPPDPPENLQLAVLGENRYALKWTPPGNGSGLWKYAVYTAYHEDIADGKPPENAGNLIAVTGRTTLEIGPDIRLAPGDLLFVTAVSENNAESRPGRPVRLARPPIAGE
ncbi:glycoside hydrolase family 10 protein [Desulfonema ishimotonii]|nr:family 10 glycosylhydrolase [Desulfonema ishimotonii]